jgi:membrane fusion protein (multidrug efflux system)
MPDHPDHDPLPVSRARRWVASAVLFLAVAGLGLGLSAWKRASLDAEAEAAASQPEPAQAIGAEPARARRHQPATTAIGTVLALRSITLENELAGTVRTVDLPVGGVVEAGAVLVALDVAVEEAELAALEAQADLAGTLLGRMQRAHEKNGASEADVDRARAERDVALANVARTRAVIERKTVRAPFRARVGIADVHPGQYLEQGTRLTTLQGVDAAVHVDFTVVQDVAAALSVGDEVLVHGTAGSEPFRARIVAVDARVDPTTRNTLVRARVDAVAGVPAPGSSVRVAVPLGPPRDAVTVPVSALRRGPSGDHVFVLEPDGAGALRAHERKVVGGTSLGDDVVVESGLASGERVAAAGSFKLYEGALVAVVERVAGDGAASAGDGLTAPESAHAGAPAGADGNAAADERNETARR